MRVLFTTSYYNIVINIIPTLYEGYTSYSISAQNGY